MKKIPVPVPRAECSCWISPAPTRVGGERNPLIRLRLLWILLFVSLVPKPGTKFRSLVLTRLLLSIGSIVVLSCGGSAPASKSSNEDSDTKNDIEATGLCGSAERLLSQATPVERKHRRAVPQPTRPSISRGHIGGRDVQKTPLLPGRFERKTGVTQLRKIPKFARIKASLDGAVVVHRTAPPVLRVGTRKRTLASSFRNIHVTASGDFITGDVKSDTVIYNRHGGLHFRKSNVELLGVSSQGVVYRKECKLYRHRAGRSSSFGPRLCGNLFSDESGNVIAHIEKRGSMGNYAANIYLKNASQVRKIADGYSIEMLTISPNGKFLCYYLRDVECEEIDKPGAFEVYSASPFWMTISPDSRDLVIRDIEEDRMTIYFSRLDQRRTYAVGAFPKSSTWFASFAYDGRLTTFGQSGSVLFDFDTRKYATLIPDAKSVSFVEFVPGTNKFRMLRTRRISHYKFQDYYVEGSIPRL